MTPFILMHYGVGNAEDLKKMNKKIIINNINVGKNFQDHLGIDYLFKTYHPTLNSALGTWLGRMNEIYKLLITLILILILSLSSIFLMLLIFSLF